MNDEQKHTYLTRLTRLCQTNPDNIQHLQALLKTRLKSLALPALNVATQTGDPIGKILAECLIETSEYSLSEDIYLDLAEDSISLVDVFTTIAKQLVENAQQNHPDDWLFITNTMEIYAKALSHAGKHLKALDSAQKSACIHQRHSNLLSFQGLSGLSMYAECLMHAGYLADTLLVQQEVVDAYRSLEPADPDGLDEYYYAYSHSLLSLSYYYKKVGRNSKILPLSLEAIEIAKAIDTLEIEDISLLTKCERNLADTYDKLDKLDLAAQAIEKTIINARDLFTHAPDSNVLELVTTLEMAATIDARLGNKITAFKLIEEALETIQTAYKTRPDVFLSELASVFFNKANIHLVFNEISSAHTYYNKAIVLLEERYEELPESFDTLASALNNRIIVYFDLYRFEDAIKDAYRLLTLYHSKPEFMADLAVSFNTLSNCRIYNGENRKALRSINTCIRYYKRLIVQGEDFNSELAFSLASLAVIYKNQGEFELGVKTSNEALNLMKTEERLLIKAEPKAYCQLSITKIRCLIELGEWQQALKLIDNLVDNTKDNHLLENELLAEMLVIRTDIYIGLGDEEKSIHDITAAIKAYNNILNEDNIPSYRFDLARSLTTLCFLQAESEDYSHEDALLNIKEAVNLFKGIGVLFTDEVLSDFITALLYQGMLAHKCNQDKLAIESINEVLSCQKKLLDNYDIQGNVLLQNAEEHEFLLTLQEIKSLIDRIPNFMEQSDFTSKIVKLENSFNKGLDHASL